MAARPDPRARQMTSKTFGVNILLRVPSWANGEVVAEEKVEVVTTGAGYPAPIWRRGGAGSKVPAGRSLRRHRAKMEQAAPRPYRRGR
jgi:hypothetical protein